VWLSFVEKLKSDRGDYIRLDSEAKEYIRSHVVLGLKFNAREIRNGKSLTWELNA
jgi:hypothetical protein